MPHSSGGWGVEKGGYLTQGVGLVRGKEPCRSDSRSPGLPSITAPPGGDLSSEALAGIVDNGGGIGKRHDVRAAFNALVRNARPLFVRLRSGGADGRAVSGPTRRTVVVIGEWPQPATASAARLAILAIVAREQPVAA